METQRMKRVSILKIPVDIVTEENLEAAAKSMFSDGKNHQIVLLSLWDLMRARRSAEFRTMINGASLVVPISKAIPRAAAFLRKDIPERWEPFQFVISFLSIVERAGKSVYILGSDPKNLVKAESNLRVTFPGMKIVGRFNGYFDRSTEQSIVSAIRKSTPSLILVGKGVPNRERWIPHTMKYFNAGIFMWVSDLLEVFSKKRSRIPESLFSRGLEWIIYTLEKPWKVLRVFEWMWFHTLLLFSRIRGK